MVWNDREEHAEAELDARRMRIIDMYEAGHLDRVERDRRLGMVYAELGRLESRRVVASVPAVDWGWSPQTLNSVLRALFERIDLNEHTFEPVAFTWRVPEWRSA